MTREPLLLSIDWGTTRAVIRVHQREPERPTRRDDSISHAADAIGWAFFAHAMRECYRPMVDQLDHVWSDAESDDSD